MAHRASLLSSQNFALVLVTAFLIAMVGFILSALGFYALWHNAAKGGTRSAWALAFCLPVLSLGLLAAFMIATTAPLSDISTDKLDPPHFSGVVEPSDGENINEPPRVDAQMQTQYYPDVSGRRYALPVETIVTHVAKQVAFNGWELASEKPRYVGDGDWLIEATVKTNLFGFVDKVVLRITDEGNASYVDMRSTSNYGTYDLGANARRIKDFMQDLDVRVSLQVPA
jgi:hypothetical protein